MTQLSPSNLFNSQIATEMNQFRNDYAAGKFSSLSDIVSNLWAVVGKLNDNMHKPLTQYEPVIQGEPPTTEKMNRFWRGVQNDITNMEDQLVTLQAASLFMYNFFQIEVQKAINMNGQASNKLKTLQLYASAHETNIITFGDFFRNQDFIDLKSNTQLVSLDIPGHISLGRSGAITNLTKGSGVTILSDSNGFVGNNQEIEDPSKAVVNPVDGKMLYKFKAETDRHANLNSITDVDPSTWIEYEANLVSADDRSWAKNFNFVYQQNADDTGQSKLLNWATGPLSNVLKLNLEFNLNTVQTINRIAYTPFGLEGNINYPIKVNSIQVSETGTDWKVLNPQNVFVGVDVNLKAANTADNISINAAEWVFPETAAQFVRVSLEQSNAIASNIGHLYYLNKTGDRIEGPVPLITNPAQYYNQNQSVVRGDLIQNVEFFQGQRWIIGIRDILVQQVQYQSKSIMISKPFRVNGIVDRVVIEADFDLPSTFPSDQAWVKFFVSPDDGINWYQISRIQDDFFGIPEIIAFNDPLPVEFREQGVAYFSVNNTVNNLRVKIEISRPDDQTASTPVVKSYTLKVRTK